jgi:hypothetical protein
MTMMPKRSRPVYIEGPINCLVDSVLHPFMKGEDKIQFMLLDAVAHSLVEQDSQKSFRKFMRFTMPELVNEAYGRRDRNHARVPRDARSRRIGSRTRLLLAAGDNTGMRNCDPRGENESQKAP